MPDILDLRELADEWQEMQNGMEANVPNTEGMSYGEVAEATERLLAAPEQAERLQPYVDLCNELGLQDATPDSLRWWANNYDPTLIAEDHFEDYARDLAEEIGAIGDEAHWPLTCIDWSGAADELRMDYTPVEYDGETYYYRD